MFKFEPKSPLFDLHPKDAETTDFFAAVSIVFWPVLTVVSLCVLIFAILT